MQLPKVSIIIINYNGKHHLESCLESLLKINYDNIEIIVVDNNSTDDSVSFISTNFPDLILIKLNENKGFAEPNNLGAKIAKGDFLLLLNNDILDNMVDLNKVNVLNSLTLLIIILSSYLHKHLKYKGIKSH